jgi:hypothetical protein
MSVLELLSFSTHTPVSLLLCTLYSSPSGIFVTLTVILYNMCKAVLVFLYSCHLTSVLLFSAPCTEEQIASYSSTLHDAHVLYDCVRSVHIFICRVQLCNVHCPCTSFKLSFYILYVLYSFCITSLLHDIMISSYF